PQLGCSADSGLITKESKHSVSETVQRFESAVNAKSANGWMVFTEIYHAAAAEKYGLKLLPRTVVVFGNPKLGTPGMQKARTAIESGCCQSNWRCTGCFCSASRRIGKQKSLPRSSVIGALEAGVRVQPPLRLGFVTLAERIDAA